MKLVKSFVYRDLPYILLKNSVRHLQFNIGQRRKKGSHNFYDCHAFRLLSCYRRRLRGNKMDTRTEPNINTDDGSGTAVEDLTCNVICSIPNPFPSTCERVTACPCPNACCEVNIASPPRFPVAPFVIVVAVLPPN